MAIQKKEFFQQIINRINNDFNQNHMPEKNKPYHYGYAVVFFWGCGGIILYEQWMQTFMESDGHWLFGEQGGLHYSSSWMSDLAKCLQVADEYLQAVGIPYYFAGTNVICGYALPSEPS